MKGEGINVDSVKEDNVEVGPVSRGGEVKELVKENWDNIDEIEEEGDNDNDDDVGNMKEENVEVGPVIGDREVKELVKEDWDNIDEIYIEEEDWDNDNDVGASDEDSNVSMIYNDDDGASDEDDVSGWEMILLIEVCADTTDVKLSKLVDEDWGSDKRDDNDDDDRGDGKEGNGLVAKADVRDNGVGSGAGINVGEQSVEFVLTEQDDKELCIGLQFAFGLLYCNDRILVLLILTGVELIVSDGQNFRRFGPNVDGLVKVRYTGHISVLQSLQILIQWKRSSSSSL